jgi:hypothetical protein
MTTQAAQQYGIKETKEALDLVLGGVKAFNGAKADGTINTQDLGQLLILMPLIQPAFDKIDQVPKEMGELSAEESAELVAHISAGLAVDGAKAKIYIASGLKILHKSYLIFVDVREMQAALAAA